LELTVGGKDIRPVVQWSLMIGSVYCDASDTDQGEHSKQHQFGRVVHQTVKDIRIYWTS
jgi:hypothetical protein